MDGVFILALLPVNIIEINLNNYLGLLSLSFGIALSLLQFFRLYSISTCLSSNLDATVGPKCNWRSNATIAPEWDESVGGSSSNASITSGHTGSGASSYVLSDVTITNESHPTTASTTKCSSLINTPSPPVSNILKRPLKSYPSAVEHLVSNALALTNNGAVCSTLNDRSLDILKRRTYDKGGPPVNSIVNKLKTLEASRANNDSSGFQSRSSISISVSNSSLESIALNEAYCPMTDDETEDTRKSTDKSFKSRHLAF